MGKIARCDPVRLDLLAVEAEGQKEGHRGRDGGDEEHFQHPQDSVWRYVSHPEPHNLQVQKGEQRPREAAEHAEEHGRDAGHYVHLQDPPDLKDDGGVQFEVPEVVGVVKGVESGIEKIRNGHRNHATEEDHPGKLRESNCRERGGGGGSQEAYDCTAGSVYPPNVPESGL